MKIRSGLIFVLLAGLILAGCFSGEGDADRSSASADDASDDDTGVADDDDDDFNDDDTSTPSVGHSLRLGIVHYHYYGDLGGYEGEDFEKDQEWAAHSIDLGIIGWGDEWMQRAWEAIETAGPEGSWLKWRLAHFFAVNQAAGNCSDPSVGETDGFYDLQTQEFEDFLDEFLEYGDGESCFLHARNDGNVTAHWHVYDCDVELTQKGYEGEAADMKDARIFTLVWDEYGWLFDLSGDCAKDYMTWRTVKDMQEQGYGGAGFDNIGSPMGDGFYLPELTDAIDVMEIEDADEADASALDDWWYATLESFLPAVTQGVRAEEEDAVIVYNGASYCSWDGGVERLERIMAEGLGVWCENALQYPGWGTLNDADRMIALNDLSAALADNGGFVALETFYHGGTEDPTAEEIYYYLAAYYLYKNGRDVLAIKPDWDPYALLREACWFDVFSRDLGAPAGEMDRVSGSLFTRAYERSDGLVSLVAAHTGTDGSDGPIALDGEYCRLDSDNELTLVEGNLSLATGEAAILLKNDTGVVHCE